MMQWAPYGWNGRRVPGPPSDVPRGVPARRSSRSGRAATASSCSARTSRWVQRRGDRRGPGSARESSRTSRPPTTRRSRRSRVGGADPLARLDRRRRGERFHGRRAADHRRSAAAGVLPSQAHVRDAVAETDPERALPADGQVGVSAATQISPRVRWLAEPIAPIFRPLSSPADPPIPDQRGCPLRRTDPHPWIPANVTFIGFFRNFLLMASFLGIGAGILFGRDDATPSDLAVCALPLARDCARRDRHPRGPDRRQRTRSSSVLPRARAAADLGFLVLALIVMLALDRHGGSRPSARRASYLDAAASCLRCRYRGFDDRDRGVLILSGLGTPPALWFAVAACVLGLLAVGAGVTRWSIISGLMLAGDCHAVGRSSSLLPTIMVALLSDLPSTNPTRALTLFVNGIPHQALWPIERAAQGGLLRADLRWFPGRTYDDVLIVGAGSGIGCRRLPSPTARSMSTPSRSIRTIQESVSVSTPIGRTTIRESCEPSMTVAHSFGAAPTATTSSSSRCRTRSRS